MSLPWFNCIPQPVRQIVIGVITPRVQVVQYQGVSHGVYLRRMVDVVTR